MAAFEISAENRKSRRNNNRKQARPKKIKHLAERAASFLSSSHAQQRSGRKVLLVDKRVGRIAAAFWRRNCGTVSRISLRAPLCFALRSMRATENGIHERHLARWSTVGAPNEKARRGARACHILSTVYAS
jgi:hypothetical protein